MIPVLPNAIAISNPPCKMCEEEEIGNSYAENIYVSIVEDTVSHTVILSASKAMQVQGTAILTSAVTLGASS